MQASPEHLRMVMRHSEKRRKDAIQSQTVCGKEVVAATPRNNEMKAKPKATVKQGVLTPRKQSLTAELFLDNAPVCDECVK